MRRRWVMYPPPSLWLLNVGTVALGFALMLARWVLEETVAAVRR